MFKKASKNDRRQLFNKGGGEESIESQEVSINKASQQTKNSAKLANTRIYTNCEYLLDTIKILCNFIEKFCEKVKVKYAIN